MITTKVEKDKEKKTEKQKLGKEYGRADRKKRKPVCEIYEAENGNMEVGWITRNVDRTAKEGAREGGRLHSSLERQVRRS